MIILKDDVCLKEASGVLASHLSEHGILDSKTKITLYRYRDEALSDYFFKEDNFVFCKNVKGLLTATGVPQYKPGEWRLFIDSSKQSLKCVLLHNASTYAGAPIGHSVTLKESYSTVKMVLQKLSYNKHKWAICVDLKMVNILLGQQAGYVKYPCFLCLWDSRADDQHWQRKDWLVREELVVGENNVINEPLVDRDSILLPPLHIKLGLMKQFVKVLDRNGDCFRYIRSRFPGTSYEKVRAGIFDGPQIRTLIRDPAFVLHVTVVESATWCSYVSVVKESLGKMKADCYQDIVKQMLTNFQAPGARMSIKIHYLFSHLGRFPENLGEVSEKQGERFYRAIKNMEMRYQGQ